MGRKIKKNSGDGVPEFQAVHRYARISPSKVRVVMNQIRGISVSEALDQLRFSPRRGAFMINKVLVSAIANMDHKVAEGHDDIEGWEDMDAEDLYVHEAFVDVGPSFRRWRPRARGMACPIIKRSSHITIKLRPQARSLAEQS